ncbi:MAG: TatD family hydrolase [Bacilli bacterium]|nr:TatD family hydrolase [Bacilli bacterium]
MFVDTHCHIYKDYYEDIEFILGEAKNNNVEYVINNGCDRRSNKEVLELLNVYKNMYGAIGIHPESVLDYTEDDLKFIEDNINNPKVVAVGEIGLDYHYTKEDKDKQIELFEAQLKLAEKYRKPVIIHSREATADTIEILKKYNVKGVIHSFSGSYETAMIYIKMGYLLGVNGVVTFKNSNLKDVLKRIPLEHIIVETDSPYLTPVPFRGKQNAPKYVIHVAEFLSELYSVSLEELAKVTNTNIRRIFDINM